MAHEVARRNIMHDIAARVDEIKALKKDRTAARNRYNRLGEAVKAETEAVAELRAALDRLGGPVEEETDAADV